MKPISRHRPVDVLHRRSAFALLVALMGCTKPGIETKPPEPAPSVDVSVAWTGDNGMQLRATCVVNSTLFTVRPGQEQQYESQRMRQVRQDGNTYIEYSIKVKHRNAFILLVPDLLPGTRPADLVLETDYSTTLRIPDWPRSEVVDQRTGATTGRATEGGVLLIPPGKYRVRLLLGNQTSMPQ